jgi:hypothetical protein
MQRLGQPALTPWPRSRITCFSLSHSVCQAATLPSSQLLVGGSCAQLSRRHTGGRWVRDSTRTTANRDEYIYVVANVYHVCSFFICIHIRSNGWTACYVVGYRAYPVGPPLTLGLRSFCAPVMSPREEILGFPIEQLVWFPSLSIGTRGLAASLIGSSRVARDRYSNIARTDDWDASGRPSYNRVGSSPERPLHFRCFGRPWSLVGRS